MLYRGVGDGTFLDGPVLPSGVRPTLAVTGDVNADNWGDIVGVDNPTTGDNARAWVIRQQPGTGDATGPTVTLIVPAAGAVVQGPAVAVAAAVIDDGSGVSRVDFFGSNGLIGSSDVAPVQRRVGREPMAQRTVHADGKGLRPVRESQDLAGRSRHASPNPDTVPRRSISLRSRARS